MNFLAIYPDKIDFGTGVLISILAIIMVFVILYVIILCVQLSQLFFKNKKEHNVTKEITNTNNQEKNKEIKDEDMMIAALIATIEFKNETNMDAKLVSIKQIN